MKKKAKIYRVKEKAASYLAVANRGNLNAARKNQYAVIIEQDEDGFFVASVPALPGCYTQAKTLSGLRGNIKDAIKLCLSVAKKDVGYQNQIKAAYQPSFIAMEMVTV